MRLVSTTAITYAKSLLEADNNALSGLNAVSNIINSSKDFVFVMENPTISQETKFEIIDEVFKNELDEKVLNFLKILVEKNRFKEFDQIYQAYTNEVDKINNLKRVEVISAVQLSKEQKQKTKERLQTRLQKNVEINWTLDKEIIGGLVIKIDDNIIDSSLKNKLDKLSKI